MGCTASHSLSSATTATASQDNPYTTDEYRQQARAMFARIQVIPPMQRKRSRSVGLSEENGMYWVYWRPGRKENGRRERAELI